MAEEQEPPPATQLSQFFTSYQDFDYNPTASVSAEYYRLVNTYQLERGSAEGKRAWEGFSEAMGKQFNAFYGSDVNDLFVWQALCGALEVDSVPDTIDECKEVIKSKHVNLVDFIDTHLTGEPVHIFKTEAQLRAYTKANGKFFPRESAKESGVLKYLLRKILHGGGP